MVGATGQNQNAQVVFFGISEGVFSGLTQLVFISLKSLKTGSDRFPHLELTNAGIDILQIAMQGSGQSTLAVNIKIGMEKVFSCQRIHIPLNGFTVIGNDRAVIMIIRRFFVYVIGQAGIENQINSLFNQFLDMAVHHFCRITNSVRGNGELSLFVAGPGG